MATNVSICNLALARIGQRDPIDSLDEESTAAQQCKLLFEHCRDTVLAAFPWPFATKRATLAAIDGATRTGWEYVYAVPADMLRPRLVPDPSGLNTREGRTTFMVESNDSGDDQVLLSNYDSVELSYTARVTNPSMFSQPFVDALAWLLASELAVAVANKPEYRQQALVRYEQQLSRAQASELGSSQETEQDPELVTARR